jgi:hypothetical protein
MPLPRPSICEGPQRERASERACSAPCAAPWRHGRPPWRSAWAFYSGRRRHRRCLRRCSASLLQPDVLLAQRVVLVPEGSPDAAYEHQNGHGRAARVGARRWRSRTRSVGGGPCGLVIRCEGMWRRARLMLRGRACVGAPAWDRAETVPRLRRTQMDQSLHTTQKQHARAARFNLFCDSSHLHPPARCEQGTTRDGELRFSAVSAAAPRAAQPGSAALGHRASLPPAERAQAVSPTLPCHRVPTSPHVLLAPKHTSHAAAAPPPPSPPPCIHSPPLLPRLAQHRPARARLLQPRPQGHLHRGRPGPAPGGRQGAGQCGLLWQPAAAARHSIGQLAALTSLFLGSGAMQSQATAAQACAHARSAGQGQSSA